MPSVEDIYFTNNAGRRLAGRIYRPDKAGDAGVLFSHGLFSSKDGYKITRMADDIAATGHPLMTFDFSCAGESGGSIADLSTLQEVEDLASAVDCFRERGMKRIHLMGSSMGAAVSILYASRQDPSIESLILIAAPVDLQGLFTKATGIADVSTLPTDGMTAVEGIGLKNSFFLELPRIDMIRALNDIRVPVLAIHGGRDSVVEPRNVDLLEENVSTFTKTVIIDDGDHNLTRETDIRFLKDTIINWLQDEYCAYA
ncbi:MAG TPA: alpha/beta hydrolase [Spirochaetota bacterium]|nr:alpha/beta hydrolase [Spirochaetota bacterium]HPV40270.1 alpha/beta hydrolase [Spirochaetota bacterium]